jgi:UDP-N-acetyl-2-amino-2-deoxyglucuronate dehydrogenase
MQKEPYKLCKINKNGNPKCQVIQSDLQTDTLKFYVIGKGFIYPKHQEAIESVGGEITDNINKADWVVILTPNFLHYKMVCDAINLNKNVLCEKPLALSSRACKNIIKKAQEKRVKIITVSQLRYLPILKKVKIKKKNSIKIDVDVHRDEKYFKSWRGDERRSGGILFNLGIHYFDIIINLFGEPINAGNIIFGRNENIGQFAGKNYCCHYRFSYLANQDEQKRIFKINGVNYDLKTNDNMHKFIYKDLLSGMGMEPKEALKAILLIERLNK